MFLLVVIQKSNDRIEFSFLTYNSVVYNGMSRGISFRPRDEQSTVVRSQWQADGHSVSIRHSPAKRVRYSSLPVNYFIIPSKNPQRYGKK